MGKKDIAEKTLISLSDVFADICNVLIFKGRQVVKPEALMERSGFSQYKAANGRIHEQMRDVVKLWKNCNIGLALIGVENQTKSDKDMPFRIIGYDGAAYRGQLKKDNIPSNRTSVIIRTTVSKPFFLRISRMTCRNSSLRASRRSESIQVIWLTARSWPAMWNSL